MVATFISLLAVYFLAFQLPPSIAQQSALNDILIGIPFMLLFSLLLVPAISWSAIQKTQQKVFPRAYELIFRDYLFFGFIAEIVAFTLFSIGILLTAPPAGISLIAFLCWVVLFGISIDLMSFFVRRLLRYSHHQFLLGRVDKEVVRLVGRGNDKEAFQWLETAIEVAARAVDKKNIHVAKDALRSVQSMCEHFVRAASRVGALRPLGASGPSLLDEVSYLSAYVCRRLDWLSGLAMAKNFDPISEDIVSTLGKMSLFFARYNPQVAKLPLLFAERAARAALQQGRDELAAQCCFTLSEVAKGLIVISKEKGESRKEAIFAALQHLEVCVTASYQKNRDMNPALLMQPFAEVADVLGDPAFAEIPDRTEIINEVRRILQGYGALEQVVAKLQPMSK